MTMTETVELTDIPVEEVTEGRRRVVLLAGLGVLTVVVLLMLFVLPTLTSDGAPEQLPPPAAVDAVDPAAGAAAPEVATSPAPPPAVHVYVGGIRSPFQQLATSSTDPGATTSTTAAATVAAPATTATLEVASGSATATAAPPAARVGTALVRLVGIADEGGVARAHVTVDGVGHMVAAGEQFGGRYRLVAVSGECATLEAGATRFALCAGDEVRK